MKTIPVSFTHVQESMSVSIEELRKAAVQFLGHYGTASSLGEPFAALLDSGIQKTDKKAAEETAEQRGEKAFSALLETLDVDEETFFTDIVRQLEPASHKNPVTVKISGTAIPKRLLLAILEVLVPGDNLISIQNVSQYEQLTNIEVPEEEKEAIQKVIDTYPVRLSKHVVRQARISKDVAYQFMPFVEELDGTGLKNTWIGQFHRGLLEQMYQNRPIFVLHMTCPVYCRFCFRKHKDTRNLPTPTEEDVLEALEYIRKSPRIKEIVLTGGEPLMNRKTLTCAVEGLMKIPHIQTIRIASRCISYYPQLFSLNDSFWMRYLIDKNREMQKDNKRIEIATHFIHPDEISHYSLEIITGLVKNGIGVYTQTPYLKDCNDHGTELTELYRELRGAGSEIHYIYIPCSPIQGNAVYWTPISSGHWTAAYLRAHLSDRAMPILCTATKIGKIDWNTSGWAVERVSDDPDNIWIRTPYTDDYYRQFAPDVQVQNARPNREETLDSNFMAEIGDERLFLGNLDEPRKPSVPFSEETLHRAQQEIMKDQRNRQQIVDSGIDTVHRIHKTRVEIEADALGVTETSASSASSKSSDSPGAAAVSGSVDPAVIAYLKEQKTITDVVLSAQENLLDHLSAVKALADELAAVPHINSLRLRCYQFTYAPEEFTEERIDFINSLNRLDPAMPLRVEIETQFIHSSEFSEMHRRIIKRFLAEGVTVYNNIMLLSGINDTPDEMMKICYASRQIGIELFQLYAAGLPLQERWNTEQPIDAAAVIDIATSLRRNQSGREIPLYVVRTAAGDADFNLNALITNTRPDGVDMKLLPYTKAYYTEMDPDYVWPERVRGEIEGAPVVEVPGLTVQTNRKFFIR